MWDRPACCRSCRCLQPALPGWVNARYLPRCSSGQLASEMLQQSAGEASHSRAIRVLAVTSASAGNQVAARHVTFFCCGGPAL